jgi:2-dehydro-3-deoxyphosphogluconate aldolase/(4S)-4-hydroxy-2-oxoglutarate aldolase
VRSLLQLLPDTVIVPTGGIALEDVPRWLGAGSHAVGVGSDLLAPGAFDRLAGLLESRGGAY